MTWCVILCSTFLGINNPSLFTAFTSHWLNKWQQSLMLSYFLDLGLLLELHNCIWIWHVFKDILVSIIWCYCLLRMQTKQFPGTELHEREREGEREREISAVFILCLSVLLPVKLLIVSACSWQVKTDSAGSVTRVCTLLWSSVRRIWLFSTPLLATWWFHWLSLNVWCPACRSTSKC